MELSLCTRNKHKLTTRSWMKSVVLAVTGAGELWRLYCNYEAPSKLLSSYCVRKQRELTDKLLHGSTPCRISCTLSLPSCEGNNPCSDASSGSQPAVSSSLQVCRCPRWAARCSAVWPRWSTAFTWRETTFCLGDRAAHTQVSESAALCATHWFKLNLSFTICRLLLNLLWFLTLASCLPSTSMTSLWPFSDARWRGVSRLKGNSDTNTETIILKLLVSSCLLSFLTLWSSLTLSSSRWRWLLS